MILWVDHFKFQTREQGNSTIRDHTNGKPLKVSVYSGGEGFRGAEYWIESESSKWK